MGDATDLIKQFGEVSSAKELKSLYSSLIEDLGIDYYIIANRVHKIDAAPGTFLIGNYPEVWINVYFENDYHHQNPVHIVSQKVSRLFLWKELPSLMNIDGIQEKMLRDIYKFFVGDACTLPVHLPSEPSGMCTFAVKKGRGFPAHALPLLSFIGALGFDAARRLARDKIALCASDTTEDVGAAKVKLGLTERQLEVLALLGQGKTDWEIAKILGISASTVRKHVEAAKKHYDVASRTQLVVRALIATDLSFRDLITP